MSRCRQILFRCVQQINHLFADVFVEEVMFQRGEGQEARACNDVDAVCRSAQADERRVHFPFGGWIEEREFLSLLDVASRHHLHLGGIEDHVRVA